MSSNELLCDFDVSVDVAVASVDVVAIALNWAFRCRSLRLVYLLLAVVVEVDAGHTIECVC